MKRMVNLVVGTVVAVALSASPALAGPRTAVPASAGKAAAAVKSPLLIGLGLASAIVTAVAVTSSGRGKTFQSP